MNKDFKTGSVYRLLHLTGLAVVLFTLTGCTLSPQGDSDSDSKEPSAAEVIVADDHREPTAPAEPDELAYNLSRLADREYTRTYGDGENEKIWYTAAEALGEIGKPAVPHLVERLDSDDEHEVMLALYALQLATQDPALIAQTDGNYISLPSVLNPRANQHNKAIALSWWNEYRYIWGAD